MPCVLILENVKVVVDKNRNIRQITWEKVTNRRLPSFTSVQGVGIVKQDYIEEPFG